MNADEWPITHPIRRIYRIGVQTLSYADGHWWVAIRNHTYQSRVELTEAQAQHWYHALRDGDPCLGWKG